MYQDLPIWAYILITLFFTHITIAAVTIFLHRHQTHRSVDLHPVVSHFFRFWLWLTTGMRTRDWVAVHRKHHARVETAGDPHSPQFFGIKKVLFDGVDLYRTEAANPETLEVYGRGTPDDWLEKNIYSARPSLGITLLFIIYFLLFGFIGITIWAIQMVWIPFLAAGVINGVGHWWGYRNFESLDTSTNIIPFGLLIGGEELHNNHHAFASSARFSSRWFEFDLGWHYIHTLQSLGLARVRKLAPRLIIDVNKRRMDLDTVRAVVANRLHVTADYARVVVKKVYKEEKLKATVAKRKLLTSSRKLLSRHESLMDAGAKRKLEELFDQSEALQTVHEFGQRLQRLWQEQSANYEKMLEALQEWCHQAEASGIEVLQEFAVKLRGYTLQQAISYKQ